jgi:hypothetical protein
MAIFRGVGGSGDSSDNSFLQEVTAQANAASASASSASASASAASASASAASASASSILNLTAATGAAGTDASYDASTGVLTVPRGADGSDASVTAANVTGVLTGGTGISIASNGTITNDSPDQTVALTGTGATTITGTYPNFTINSTNTTYTVGDGGLTTNDFTDADHSKLDGIEANADVTDTANVTSAGAAMLASSPTFTGTITAPNVDISTTGTVTTNIATGNHDNTSSTKTVNIGTGFSGFLGGLTTINIGTQSTSNQNTVNIGSGVSDASREDTINLKGNVTVDGTLSGLSYNYSIPLFSGYTNLTTSVTQIGNDFYLRNYNNKHYKRFVEVNAAMGYSGTTSTNDLNLRVIMVVPTSSGNAVDIGSVVSITTTAIYNRDIVFSDYAGVGANSNGATPFTAVVNAVYNPTTDQTTFNAGVYNATIPSVGDSIYVHPFDWESSGTEIYGHIKQFDVDAEAAMSYQIYTKVYFGNIDRITTCRFKFYETASSDSINIQRLQAYQTDESA